ncbi:MAG: cupin domain-containing protein [Bacteroidota bacterium]
MSKLSLNLCLIFWLGIITALSAQNDNEAVIRPLLLDKSTLSGDDLKPISNPNEPERQFFQKNLYRGPKISVYIVSSETWPGEMDNFGIDEFLYVLNGRARISPHHASERVFERGDYFFAHRGYTGAWETQGDYYYELSVITTRRADSTEQLTGRLPEALDQTKLSGFGLTKVDSSGGAERYHDVLASGIELSVSIEAESPQIRKIANPLPEQLVGVLAGKLTLTATDGQSQTFFAGDWFVLPQGFRGSWESEGHRLCRTLRVYETPND